MTPLLKLPIPFLVITLLLPLSVQGCGEFRFRHRNGACVDMVKYGQCCEFDNWCLGFYSAGLTTMYCNTTTWQCTCASDYFWSEEAGGCIQPHWGVQQCPPGEVFFRGGGHILHKCEKPHHYGESCGSNKQCREKEDNLKCNLIMQQCVCMNGTKYNNNTNKCDPSSDPVPSIWPTTCPEPTASGRPDKTMMKCENEGFIHSNGSCVWYSDYGGCCENDTWCHPDHNLKCDTNNWQCVCTEGNIWHDYYGRCGHESAPYRERWDRDSYGYPYVIKKPCQPQKFYAVGYYRYERYCYLKEHFGGECGANSQCREWEGLVCNFVARKCVCKDGTNFNKTSGICEATIETSTNPFQTLCPWPATHPRLSYTPHYNKQPPKEAPPGNCSYGYFENENGLCLPQRGLGESCKRDGECFETNPFLICAFTDGDWQFDTAYGKCQCDHHHVTSLKSDNKGWSCELQEWFGVTTTELTLNINKEPCPSRHYRSINGTCEKQKPYPELCDTDRECDENDPHLVCSKEQHIRYHRFRITHGGECLCDLHSSAGNTYNGRLAHKCTPVSGSCPHGYFKDDKGGCEKKRWYGQSCKYNEECDDSQNFVCDQCKNKCTCKYDIGTWLVWFDPWASCHGVNTAYNDSCPVGTYGFQKGCAPKKNNIGEECKAHIHCNYEQHNLYCDFETLRCDCAYGDKWDNATEKCVRFFTPELAIIGTTETSVSKCETGYFNNHDGICEKKRWYGKSCERNEECDDSKNFVCDQCTKKCTCKHEPGAWLFWFDRHASCKEVNVGFYDCPPDQYYHNRRCYDKKKIGEDCLAHSRCNLEDHNLYCDFETQRCACAHGDKWDNATEKCVGVPKTTAGLTTTIQPPTTTLESPTTAKAPTTTHEPAATTSSPVGGCCDSDDSCDHHSTWEYFPNGTKICQVLPGYNNSQLNFSPAIHTTTTNTTESIIYTTEPPRKRPMDPCEIPKLRGEIEFTSTGISKYIYPTDKTFTLNSEESYAACISMGLEPAMINSTKDFDYLEKEFTWALNMTTVRLAIAASDKHRWSVANDTVVGKSMFIELFPLRHTEYLDIRESCIALVCEIEKCTYQDVHCTDDKDLMPLCQYKQNTSKNCYGIQERSEDYGFDLAWEYSEDPEESLPVAELGEFGGKKYYGSKTQQSFEEAKTTCESLGYDLLKFTPDQFKTKDIIWDQIVNNYLMSSVIGLWQGVSWVSGIYNETGASFSYEMKDDSWEWKWMQNNGKTEGKNERCLMIFIMTTAQNFGVRPIACNMPNFFLCHEK